MVVVVVAAAAVVVVVVVVVVVGVEVITIILLPVGVVVLLVMRRTALHECSEAPCFMLPFYSPNILYSSYHCPVSPMMKPEPPHLDVPLLNHTIVGTSIIWGSYSISKSVETSCDARAPEMTHSSWSPCPRTVPYSPKDR